HIGITAGAYEVAPVPHDIVDQDLLIGTQVERTVFWIGKRHDVGAGDRGGALREQPNARAGDVGLEGRTIVRDPVANLTQPLQVLLGCSKPDYLVLVGEVALLPHSV